MSAIASDSQDRVYFFNRGDHSVIILDRDGRFLDAWGKGHFARPHGITIVSDCVYCVDDFDHAVKVISLDGELMLTLGTSGQPADTGAMTVVYRNIQRVGPPFCLPTNVAISPGGDLYVADGYGNARIHQFTFAGQLLRSWGASGEGPGQFQIPHGIAVDRNGTVYVADRENSRIQLFSPEGNTSASGEIWHGRARYSLTTMNISMSLRTRLSRRYCGRHSPAKPQCNGWSRERLGRAWPIAGTLGAAAKTPDFTHRTTSGSISKSMSTLQK